MEEEEILIYGVVGDEWAGLDAATLVPLISAGTGALSIRINSPGGWVIEGLAIYNALTRAQAAGRRVTCHIDGLAASMASVIAMAGDEIIMADNALMMVHNPWDCAMGDAQELRRAADQLDRLRDTIVGIYARKTGLATDALIAMLDAETWLNAADALAQGFITTISAPASASACNIQKFGFKNTPKHPLIAGKARAQLNPTVAPVTPKQKGLTMDEEEQIAAAAAAAAEAAATAATNIETGVATALAAERSRVAAIRNLGRRHSVEASVIDGLIDAGTPLATAQTQILDNLAARGDAHGAGHPSVQITKDAREKFNEGALNWLMIRSGVASMVQAAAAKRGEAIKIDAGEFSGVSMVDLARESLQMANVRLPSRNPKDIMGSALTARNDITQGVGDFPILLENLMHKTLQASYGITPDTWSRFCGKGTVTDFRIFNRYLRGTFGALDTLTDTGEFKNKAIPDGEKQVIQAGTKGNIITLSRQALINDDLGAFISLAMDLGRAAKLTIEKDVYALLIANPNMNDGYALFSSQHANIAGTAAAVGVAAFDAARVAMASQKDPSGNDYLDIRPDTWLGPLTYEGQVKVIIGSPYDPDAANKLQRPNMVQGLVKDVVGTPRLAGTGWYMFGDKDQAPAIEVAFLNGVEEPFLDNELGWRVDGTEWKVRLDYGVAPVNWRSAYYNAGA